MCRPVWIDGSATLTIVKSSTTMNCAMASTISRGVPGTRPGFPGRVTGLLRPARPEAALFNTSLTSS
jgi:hypothetical protein